MKKIKICSLVLSAALTAALAVGLAGCGTGNISELYGEGYEYTEPTLTSGHVAALDGWEPYSEGPYSSAVADAYGLVLFTRTENGAASYRLYDYAAMKEIVTAESFITPVTDGYSVPIGIYVVQTAAGDGSAQYEYYAKNGRVKTSTEKITASEDGGSVAFADGTVLVVGADGNVTEVTRDTSPVFTPTAESYLELEDVYIQKTSSDGQNFRVWSKEGKRLRDVALFDAWNIPASAEYFSVWGVGNSLFVQYDVALPDRASDYDYSDEYGTKYGVETKRYDFAAGKAYDCGIELYVAGKVETFSNALDLAEYGSGGVMLEGYLIRGKKLASAACHRYYGEDGTVRVDLDAYLSGASGFRRDGEYIVLSNGAETKVYRGDKLMASADGSLDFAGGFFSRSRSNDTLYYNLDGSVALSVPDGGDITVLARQNNTLYYMQAADTETAVYAYTQAEGAVKLGTGRGYAMSPIYLLDNADGTVNVYQCGYQTPLVQNAVDDGSGVPLRRICEVSLRDGKRYFLYSADVMSGGAQVTQYFTVVYGGVSSAGIA